MPTQRHFLINCKEIDWKVNFPGCGPEESGWVTDQHGALTVLSAFLVQMLTSAGALPWNYTKWPAFSTPCSPLFQVLVPGAASEGVFAFLLTISAQCVTQQGQGLFDS